MQKPDLIRDFEARQGRITPDPEFSYLPEKVRIRDEVGAQYTQDEIQAMKDTLRALGYNVLKRGGR